MASVKAGVVSGVEVNGPLNSSPTVKVWDPTTGGTWCLIWFIVAIVILFVVL